MENKSQSKNAIFSKAFDFIKNNLAIGYSLILLFLAPAAFFAYGNLINAKYADMIDNITRKEAILAEDILNNAAGEKFYDHGALQELVKKIARENDEIVELSILSPRAGTTTYDVIASSDPVLVGKTREDNYQLYLARTEANGVFLDENQSGRFWRVIKAVRGNSNEKIGYMVMSLSLNKPDALMNEVITFSYWMLALIVLILVLLQANQIRLLSYAFSLNKLKEVDKMKDMFISMASHELRAPLAAIKGYLDLMKGDKNLVLGGDSARYFENISISAKRLEGLVEDMLEVSRLEGNRFPLEITEFDPYPLIGQSVEEMRSQAIQKNLELLFEKSNEPTIIRADASRVKQVAVNLIGNALKYTEKGSIKVTATIKKGEFMITVADTGIGISSEEQKNLFQKFYRVKNEKTKAILGTGLGLWITAETVRRMRGRISVESIEGVGTHFTIHLPLAKK